MKACARQRLALVAVLGLGCGERPAASTKAEPALTPEEAASVDLPPDASPEQAVAINAKRYASGLVAEGPTKLGTLQAGGRSDHLLVLKLGHCYRVVGAGDAAIEDMDFLLFDPSGVQTHQDSAQDRFPVLGLQSEICPRDGGAYRLQIHMYQGGGAFAYGLYRTP